MPKCRNCGYNNANPKSKDPVYCPRCHFPYGFTPIRKYAGRWKS